MHTLVLLDDTGTLEEIFRELHAENCGGQNSKHIIGYQSTCC
jgi:hypothetical protein